MDFLPKKVVVVERWTFRGNLILRRPGSFAFPSLPSLERGKRRDCERPWMSVNQASLVEAQL